MMFSHTASQDISSESDGEVQELPGNIVSQEVPEEEAGVQTNHDQIWLWRCLFIKRARKASQPQQRFMLDSACPSLGLQAA